MLLSLLLIPPTLSWSPRNKNNYPPSSQAIAEHCRIPTALPFLMAKTSNGTEENDENDNIVSENSHDDDTDAWYKDLDVQLVEDEGLYEDDTAEDWIPDAERIKRRDNRELIPAKEVLGGTTAVATATATAGDSDSDSDDNKTTSQRPSPYTDEEETIIAAMGGKNKQNKVTREIGFLGDSTLREISRDYSIPICYLADVLVQWGADVPINIYDRLGDLVTGEQAFALAEAVNTLDVGYLNDRYSNQNLQQICDDWEIELKDAFEFTMNEGWSLPFGIRTNLRIEQEDELLRVFSSVYRDVDDD